MEAQVPLTKLHGLTSQRTVQYTLVITDPDMADFGCNGHNLVMFNHDLLETLIH
jgi:hypothetical protein